MRSVIDSLLDRATTDGMSGITRRLDSIFLCKIDSLNMSGLWGCTDERYQKPLCCACFYLSVICWYQRRRWLPTKRSLLFLSIRETSRDGYNGLCMAQTSRFLLNVYLKLWFKSPRDPDPARGHYVGWFISQRKLCLVNSGIKETPQLSRRLSQVDWLFKEEYFTIKMFLW